MHRRAALALAALATVLLAGCGGGGEKGTGGGAAEANDPFYGVISAEPLPGEAQLAQLGGGGVGTLRINLAWGSVQSGPDAPYDWSHYDPVVGGAARNGIRVLATVYSSPTWAEPTPEYPAARLARCPVSRTSSAPRSSATAPTARSGRSTRAAEAADHRLAALERAELAALLEAARRTRASYLRLLRAFHDAVKGVDPGREILLGGLFPTPSGGIIDATPSCPTSTGAARGASSTRPPSIPTREPRATRSPRRSSCGTLMDRCGDAGQADLDHRGRLGLRGSPPGLPSGRRARPTTCAQIFELAAADRDRLGIAGVIWYSLNDTPGPLWVGHCGLFSLEGQPKPSWLAFAQVAGS